MPTSVPGRGCSALDEDLDAGANRAASPGQSPALPAWFTDAGHEHAQNGNRPRLGLPLVFRGGGLHGAAKGSRFAEEQP